MDLGQIILISFLVGFIGFALGIFFAVKLYKNNRYSIVLPGQHWHLPGAGAVKIVHSSEPGSEVLYVYNLDDEYETAMGTCSRLDLIKGGFLIDLSDKYDLEDTTDPSRARSPPDLHVIPFPSKNDEDEDD
jgi:hypothetical protein